MDLFCTAGGQLWGPSRPLRHQLEVCHSLWGSRWPMRRPSYPALVSPRDPPPLPFPNVSQIRGRMQALTCLSYSGRALPHLCKHDLQEAQARTPQAFLLPRTFHKQEKSLGSPSSLPQVTCSRLLQGVCNRELDSCPRAFLFCFCRQGSSV